MAFVEGGGEGVVVVVLGGVDGVNCVLPARNMDVSR